MCVVAYGHGLIGDHKLGNHKSHLAATEVSLGQSTIL